MRTVVRASLMAAAAVLAAAGCAGGGGTSGGEPGEPLSIWQFYGDESMPTGKPFYDLVARYEQQSGTDVDIRFIPYDDFNRTLTQAAAAGDGPDIALISAFDTAAMADAAVIQDLSPQVEAWGQQGAYFPTNWDPLRPRGRRTGSRTWPMPTPSTSTPRWCSRSRRRGPRWSPLPRPWAGRAGPGSR
jgi:multiple sugar transport system substrate-binding protein